MNINDLIFFTDCCASNDNLFYAHYILLTKLHNKRYLINKYKEAINYPTYRDYILFKSYRMQFYIIGIITSNYMYTNHDSFIDKFSKLGTIEFDLRTEYDHSHYYCLNYNNVYSNLYANIYNVDKDLIMKSVYGSRSIQYNWFKYDCNYN